MIKGEPEVRMDRRDFLTAAGSAATLTLTGTLGRTARADIHDLLSLLEETPRSQIIERVAARIRSGTSYEDLLTALTLATVRNVSPYPDVGFKYHAVMVLHAIHYTTMGMPPAERWLPMLWAVDYFKEEQADERHSSGWTMAAPPPVPTPAPSPDQARSALSAALDNWDLEAADAAVVNYASVAQPSEVFELLWQYGARDFRGIGHKAITVQNAHRMLNLLGWEHRDPVLRSTVAALVNFYEDPNPATVELREEAAWRQNTALRREIPGNWLQGRLDSSASADVLAALPGRRHARDRPRRRGLPPGRDFARFNLACPARGGGGTPDDRSRRGSVACSDRNQRPAVRVPPVFGHGDPTANADAGRRLHPQVPGHVGARTTGRGGIERV